MIISRLDTLRRHYFKILSDFFRVLRNILLLLHVYYNMSPRQIFEYSFWHSYEASTRSMGFKYTRKHFLTKILRPESFFPSPKLLLQRQIINSSGTGNCDDKFHEVTCSWYDSRMLPFVTIILSSFIYLTIRYVSVFFTVWEDAYMAEKVKIDFWTHSLLWNAPKLL